MAIIKGGGMKPPLPGIGGLDIPSVTLIHVPLKPQGGVPTSEMTRIPSPPAKDGGNKGNK